MTLAQAVDFVRNRHNALTDSNWSNNELYALFTARCNEILSIIGLIEGTDTSITTVSGTQAYNFPMNFVSISALLYNGEKLSPISLTQWEEQKANGTTPTGKSNYFVVWNNQVLLIPIPDGAYSLTFYGEKLHPFIDNSTQMTIDIPSILHGRLCDGVIADMAAKDENFNMSGFYEKLWMEKHIPAFQRFAFIHKRRGRLKTVQDADTAIITDYGVT